MTPTTIPDFSVIAKIFFSTVDTLNDTTMAERTQPRSFKELHSSVQTALRSKKAWAAFDSEELKKEALQYLEIMGTRNCVDVRNPSRGETNCDCFTTAIQNLSMTEAHCVGSALFDLLKKPRKQIDQDFLQWYLYADATRKALIGKPKKEQQRVFLLPGAWRYKICKNAIASFCGYGRDSYNRVVKAAEEGVVIPHGLVGRPTNRLLKHDHRPNFHSFFTKLEKFAAPRATRVVRCFNIGGNLENEMRDDDENLVELPPNMSKSSLYKRYCLEECNTIVKFNAKHKVIAKEPAVRGQEMLPCPAWSFFCDYWKENFAHLKIQKPRKDVCGECFKYANSMKTLSGHKRQLEEEGEEDLPTEYDAVLKCRRKEETHEESTRRMLELEREVEKASLHVKMAKEQRELFNLHKKAAAATRDSPKSERTATFVCDYAQNLYVPNFGDEQPGETYYYSPLNAYVFGMVDCSSNTLHAHLYMEGEGKKGGNNVASMIWMQLMNQGLFIPYNDRLPSFWKPLKELNLWFDNCGGQNKNRMVLRLLPLLLSRRVAQRISFNFLVAGHTKNDCDRMFNLLKIKYQKTNCYTPQMLVAIVSKQLDVKVYRMEESVFLDFATAQDHVMKAVEGVNTFHVFTGTMDEPSIIHCRPYHSCAEQHREQRPMIKSDFLHKDWLTELLPLLKQLKAPGLQSIKKIELFDKWGKLIPDTHRQQYKYYNEDPGLEVRGAVKRQKKESQKQRAKRHRVAVDTEIQQQPHD